MANEAGAGAINRTSSLLGYTLWSVDTASLSGNCTKLAFYGNVAENDVVKFGFYTRVGLEITLETSVYEFTISASEAGDKLHEWTSANADFTAFSVTSGWYLGLYSQGGQDYASTGGNGFYYKAGDSSGGTPNAADDALSSYIDALSADISSGSTTHALAGTIESGSEVDGIFNLTQSLIGSIESGSDIDGILSLTQSLLGTIESGSDVEALINLINQLAGSVESGSDIEGLINLYTSLSGTIESGSQLLGSLTINGVTIHQLAGSIESGSDVDGVLSVDISLVGVISSVSNLSGLLSVGDEVILSSGRVKIFGVAKNLTTLGVPKTIDIKGISKLLKIKGVNKALRVKGGKNG